MYQENYPRGINSFSFISLSNSITSVSSDSDNESDLQDNQQGCLEDDPKRPLRHFSLLFGMFKEYILSAGSNAVTTVSVNQSGNFLIPY